MQCTRTITLAHQFIGLLPFNNYMFSSGDSRSSCFFKCPYTVHSRYISKCFKSIELPWCSRGWYNFCPKWKCTWMVKQIAMLGNRLVRPLNAYWIWRNGGFLVYRSLWKVEDKPIWNISVIFPKLNDFSVHVQNDTFSILISVNVLRMKVYSFTC